jgi:uncharacterized protein (TIGR03435 family)
MQRDKQTIEEILERGLPSATRQQMEAAADRVSVRLRAERQRGTATPIRQSEARASWWWRPVAATVSAAALIAFAVLLGLPSRDQGLYAVLEAADSTMYRISEGNRIPLRVGDRIAAQETLRSNGGAGAVLALADGTRIEIGSKSELWWDRADEGLMVRLNTGSIIVSGAKEATGRLYVQTKDMTASVARTTSLVNAADDGSSVAVIEGEAEVRQLGTPSRPGQGTVEKKLHPGEHLSTSPTLAAQPLAEAIAWSRNADSHNRILAAFSQGMSTTTGALTPVKEIARGQIDAGQRAGAARPAGPAFEEASVRLCDPDALPPPPVGGRGGGSGSFQMTPGRLNALCMRVDTLIGTAYQFGPLAAELDAGQFIFNRVFGLGNVAGRQVRGGPDWVRTDRYTIEAVADGSADARTISGPMLRDLFERRFKLAAHIETEPGAGFVLTVAPGGLKMKPVTADACTPLPDSARPLPTDGSVIDRARRGEPPFCGFVGADSGPNSFLVGGATGLSQLVQMLPDILGARVIDRTNIPRDALFNYVLEFAPDERTLGPLGGRGRGRTGAQASGEPRAPDIFTAFREELGIQLEAGQASDYIVIDRIERPSPN